MKNVFLIFYLIVLMVGCAENKDVTTLEEFWGGYKSGQIYTLKEKVFLLHLSSKEHVQFALSPEGQFRNISRYYTVPLSIGDYSESGFDSEIVVGKEYQIPQKVVGIVDRGITIQCLKFIKETSYSWFFGKSVNVVVVARIVNGPHSGLNVNLNDMSVKTKSSDGINLNWLNHDLLH